MELGLSRLLVDQRKGLDYLKVDGPAVLGVLDRILILAPVESTLLRPPIMTDSYRPLKGSSHSLLC